MQRYPTGKTIQNVTCFLNYWQSLQKYALCVLIMIFAPLSVAAVTAMPLISRNKPAFSSSGPGTIYSGPALANDDNYQSLWFSEPAPAWIAYDLSGVPANQRQQVLVAWYAGRALGYLNPSPSEFFSLPIDYTIEINPAAGGASSAPTTGWQTVVTVTGNNRGSRQHLIDMAGAKWVRFRATASSNPEGVGIDLDVHAAPEGASDCWLFMGDSITGFAAYLFSDLPNKVNALAPNRWPVIVPAGIGGSNVWSANDVIDESLALYPGRYVTLNYGTNGGSDGFTAAMEVLIQKVFAAGKIPVIPHMPWSDIPDQLTKAPLINAQIDALYLKYPAIRRGPDLYTAFFGRTDLIPPGDVHPNDAGNQEIRRQWALAMTATSDTGIIPPSEVIMSFSISEGGTEGPVIPEISTFAASPVSIAAGGSTTLSWSATGATSLSISPSTGSVTGTSVSVSPTTTTTYILSATNSIGTVAKATTVTVSQSPVILYCTQVPISGFATRSSAFGNHGASMAACPRGGDLMIRYADGTLRNLTQEAGYGMTGFQGANAIAVREPSVHWSGTKALFSMVIGAPTSQYVYGTFYWQIYEVTGFGQGETVQITKVPNQPANYNNVSPIYGSDGKIIFTSDRPRNGQRHLYPQLDEYESADTVTGIWSLTPTTGDLRILTHTPSGAFNPLVDSFGRVLYTRWDHLQQDQQADTDREGGGTYGSFTYADETIAAARLPLTREVFPEPRADNHPENLSRNRSGNGFNLFMPWQINQDGTSEETVNHVGRQEFTSTYRLPLFLNDSNLTDQVKTSFFANRTYLFGADGGIFFMREDPATPGTYWGINAREFGTDSSGQIVRFTGAPTLNAEQMVITAITDPVTRAPLSGAANPAHVGLFRNPLPLTNGKLLAAHSQSSDYEANNGTRANPNYLYALRLRYLTKTGTYYEPAGFVTTGTTKNINWWDPDVKVTHNGLLWELDPVEVVARTVPPKPTGLLETPEQQVLAEEGVSETALRQWLATNKLALIVTRDNTIRDRGDVSQPFNLRVPGGVSTTPVSGKVYDISHLQLVQADQIRGYGGTTNPQGGRRVLGQFLHDPAATNPANPGGPAGSVKVGADGSSAAFVPAQRAMSWQLTDNAGEPVVVERNWITFQPGEIRTCAGCHGTNTVGHGNAASPTNKPEALRDLLRYWKTL